MKKIIALLPLICLISACATVVTGMHQPVTVKAVDQDTQETLNAARCTVKSAYGNESSTSDNPGSILAQTGYGSLDVTCAKAGYEPSTQNYSQSFNPWSLFDILLWPMAIVDLGTGAILRYPSNVTVLMSKK